uniref:Uncharacterized protein n=1 Tax=Romanomermis culicivorax TaxID=13658 RepID=A0A915JTS0_ROMCU
YDTKYDFDQYYCTIGQNKPIRAAIVQPLQQLIFAAGPFKYSSERMMKANNSGQVSFCIRVCYGREAW